MKNNKLIIDYARFDDFDPYKEFMNNIMSIKKETLQLLHQNKGWKTEND